MTVASDVLNIFGQVAQPVAQNYGSNLATAVVQKVRVESAVSPAYEVDLRAPSEPSPTRDWFMNIVRPRITVQTAFGEQVIEPYGPPGESKWPVVKWGLIGGGVLLGLILLRGVGPRW